MIIYKIRKIYRNAEDIYYIKLNDNEKMNKSKAERIGDNTEGGHNYGYRITWRKVPRIPKKLPKGSYILERNRTISIY